jgi:hypothetical protein
MPRSVRVPAAALAALAIAVLSACATPPARPLGLVPGAEATVEGNVVAVDTAPWAYDGNAVVSLATSASGVVKVQLPARWNLCKAAAPGDEQALRPGDRVRAIGTASAADTIVVCAQPQHRLRKVE